MGNGIEKTEELKSMDIKALVVSNYAKDAFRKSLPKHLTVDRFLRIALTVINKTPKLQKCTKESLFTCLMDLSQMGLEPDGRKAHLIPYGDQCTLIIDYKGLVDLARRSGEIADIHADVVFEGDKFSYSFGSTGSIEHVPALKSRGKPIAAYSFVKLKDGSVSYEVMSVEDVDAVKERSKAKTSGPWITDWNEMAKKTVFRRHSKWLPMSSERFTAALEKDFDRYPDIVNVTVGKPEVSMPKELEPKDNQPPAEATETFPIPEEEEILISEKQRAKLFAQAKANGCTEADIHEILKIKYGVDSVRKIKPEWFDNVLAEFSEKK